MGHAGVPSGSTRVAAVIGSPVRHSLSPAIHNAAFAATGLDWVFVAFDVPDGSAGRALDAMRTLDISWYSVTMPHKRAVAAGVDRLEGDAAVLGSVNCVVNREGELVGSSTDGEGFVRAVSAETGFDPTERRCVVVGAGGAARAIVQALARHGASQVAVVNRTRATAEAAAALAPQVGCVAGPEAVDGADLVVNATPVGMGADRGVPVEPERLRAGQVVVDLVYEPLRTALLVAAADRGAVAVNGIGMLVHQAAIQFETVTGRPAPVEAMAAAVRTRLAG